MHEDSLWWSKEAGWCRRFGRHADVDPFFGKPNEGLHGFAAIVVQGRVVECSYRCFEKTQSDRLKNLR
jgi:hypothetical protein